MALKYMRDNLKSLTWVLWLVVGVFVLLVFFEWGGFNRRARNTIEVAATVGNEEISFEEFQNQYRQLESRYRQTFGERFDREMAMQFNLPIQALDQLIDRRILLMEAEAIDLRVTDGEVQEAILELPIFVSEDGSNFVGPDEYKRILKANRLSVDSFENSIREDLLLSKLDSVLLETGFVADEQVESAYRETVERAKIRYIKLEASDLGGQVSVSDHELREHFDENLEDFRLPEERVVDYLLVNSVKMRREIEVPDAEIQAYYDSNQAEFDQEEQVRARHILLKITPDRTAAVAESQLSAIKTRIENGEEFGQLARDLSEDEGSASRGGSLGYFGREKMIEAFSDAAFAAEVGNLVGPVATDFGYHLIEVQDHRQGGVQSLEQVRATVRSRLVAERVTELAEAKVKDAAQQIAAGQLVSREQLAQLAEAEGLELVTSKPFGRGDNLQGIGRSPEFENAAFALEVDGFSEPVKIPRGWVIQKLVEVKASRLPDLTEVKAQVLAGARLTVQKKLSQQRLSDARRDLEIGSASSFEELASDLGVEAIETAEFGRYDSIDEIGLNRELNDLALSLGTGELGGPLATPQGALLFEVVERQVFEAAAFEDAKVATRRQQEEERLATLRASLIDVRRRDLTPRYGTRVLETFGIDAPGVG